MSTYLSPMIQHAMYLTSVLGERFLWADKFCIPHHDRGVATQQLQLMGAIYGNAVVTIIAADTDSEEGIAGLRNLSNPRKLKQEVIPFGEEKVVVRNTYGFTMQDGMPYADRGWTYQEYRLSRRKLLFKKKEIHWECSCCTRHEEMIFGAEEVDDFGEHHMQRTQNGFPHLWDMSVTINPYNKRQFRYGEDALPAISGLLSVASRSFTGGFLYGLPEMFFDCALGWHIPRYQKKNLRRRTTSQRPISSRLHPSCLPSWSWIGWQGSSEFPYGETAKILKYQDYIRETSPITTWYTADSPTATVSESRPIISTWFTNRESYKDRNTPLPPGWTRHKRSTEADELRLRPDGYGEFVFKHEATPELEWFYPFPVADITELTPPSMPEQTAYLFCETQRAYLWARGGMLGKLNEEVVGLLDVENKKVGFLHYHEDLQLEGFPDAVEYSERHSMLPLGKQVQLVAISEYKEYKLIKNNYDTPEIKYDITESDAETTESDDHATEREDDATEMEDDETEWEDDKTKNVDEDLSVAFPIQTSEYIMVLWIEWVDGVAYRLTSGEVDKEAWNKLPLENISLILG